MDHLKTATDEELVVMLREGRTDVSDYLICKYKDIVTKKARALYLMGGETEDLVQEGMIGLFKAMRDYEPGREASFETFARLCIDRQLYTAIQNSSRQKHIPLNTYVSFSSDEALLKELEIESPEMILIDQESSETLLRSFQKLLSPMENKVLDLYIKGYGYTVIARQLNRTPKSIDNALHRIRTKIREYLDSRQS